MAGTGRRASGLEDQISGLSEGQRYALALVLNLVFVGIVIGGFALLYTSGFNARQREDVAPSAVVASIPEIPESAPASPAASNEPVSAPASTTPTSDAAFNFASERAAASLDDDRSAEPETDGSFELAMLDSDRASSRRDVEPDAGPMTLETARADLAEPAALSVEDVEEEEEEEALAVEDEDEDAVALAAAPAPDAETSRALTAAAEDVAEDVVEPALGEAGTLVAANVAPSEGASAMTPRPRIDPVASLWVSAGQLVGELQSEFPCSQFLIQAGSEGRPTLRARVGASEDIDVVSDRIKADFGGETDIAPGLGCTSVIGGGYVALADGRGQYITFADTELMGDVLAALPRESTCALIGAVLATQPALVQQLARNGRRPATWVRAGGQPAICEENDAGAWTVLASTDSVGRSAPAIVLGGDVAASEARQGGGIAVPPATPIEEEPLTLAALPPTTPAPDPVFDAPFGSSLTSPIGPDGEVAPISGPSPILPPGAPASSDGYSVTVAFTVNPDGAPTDLSVSGAGMAPLPVVAAALDLVSASRFPARANAYQGRHTVRFPSTEFMNMLSRLSVTSTSPTSDGGAAPIWDRQPTPDDHERAYPRRALERNISGEVTVGCAIGDEGRLACDVLNESPRGWGFGGAALDLAGRMRAAPRMSDGSRSDGQYVDLDFVFAPADG